MDDDWKRARIEQDRHSLMRKITDPAENRMRSRTARQQLLDAQRELNREQQDQVPDSDDSSLYRGD